MKIFCKVHDKPAVVVGYGPGKKGRPTAIVITEGQMKAIRLKDVVLGELPEQLLSRPKAVNLREASGAA